MSDEKPAGGFLEIKTSEELIKYLDNASERLKNRDHLYHYTKIDRVVDIFKSKKWHLANAQCMNDRLEYNNGDKEKWKNIFFASFMTETTESIGMWSMYSQPWGDGVMIKIPRKVALDWIKGVDKIHEIVCVGFTVNRSFEVNNDNRVFLSSVAYSNCDNNENDEKLTWSTVSNYHIKNATHRSELTGYVKDSAWDYEREIRIKAVLKDGHNCSRIAIDIPEFVLNSMTVVSGPLFDGTLENRLSEEVRKRVQVSSSLFSEKLQIASACNTCSYKKSFCKEKKA